MTIQMPHANQLSVRGVQSLHRALDLVEMVANNGGAMAIGEMAASSAIPLPTIHRLLKTLIKRGYMRQLHNRRYVLGARLVPLGGAASTAVGVDAQSVLDVLVHHIGETANLAVLSGDQAQYVAQAPSRHAMRMFTEVGRQVDLHCTGVGKALLSQLEDEQVSAIVRRKGLPAQTQTTLTTELALRTSLAEIRARGYALDNEEQEIGVRCVAVPLPTAARIAISVSGPLIRMTDEVVEKVVPLLQSAASRLANDTDQHSDPTSA